MRDARIYWLLSLSGTIGLFPLLFTPRDVLTEVLLTATYTVLLTKAMQYFVEGWTLTWMDWMAAGMAVMSAVMYCLCPLLLP